MARKKQQFAMVGAAALIAVGIAAPAFAEGSRQSYMNDWIDGDGSSNWADHNTDGTDTHVTFNSCTREFRATIRKTITGAPDPSLGSEWIDCKSYADAVRVGDVPAANYHFDIGGMGYEFCNSTVGCVFNKTDVPELHIYW
jgi:hypothetical protein